MICHILIVHVLSHYIVNSKGCRCVPARCRYFSGKMSLKVRADAAIWAVYATNTIEGFNRQLRKVTKSKSVFPTDDSLFKMLYLAMIDITKKWTGRRQDWSMIHAQLAIYFEDRMPD